MKIHFMDVDAGSELPFCTTHAKEALVTKDKDLITCEMCLRKLGMVKAEPKPLRRTTTKKK